jgi:hypothetical protein
MSMPILLGAAGKGSLGTAAPWLFGIGLIVGLAAIAATVFRTTLRRAEAGSRGELDARLRALDELTGLGGLRPEEYDARRGQLLRELKRIG